MRAMNLIDSLVEAPIVSVLAQGEIHRPSFSLLPQRFPHSLPEVLGWRFSFLPHNPLQEVVIGVRNTPILYGGKPHERAQPERGVRGGLHLSGSNHFKWVLVRRRSEVAEALTQSTGACEDVNYADGAGIVLPYDGQDWDPYAMVDVMNSVKRSALMSRIRGKDTAPELLVRKQLWHAGFRYSLHCARLPGRPDIVLPKWNAVVFVHGCFWHRHANCSYFRLPKTHTAFWDEKLARNQTRDAEAVAELVARGWRVVVVWECATRADPSAVSKKLVHWLKRANASIELTATGTNVSGQTLNIPALCKIPHHEQR